jgi:hypothetical protein
MLSFVDSHSSLSQKKDKNTDRSLAHSHQLSFSLRSSESTHFIHSKKATEPHTQNNNTKQKRTAANAQVQYLSALPQVQVSPYNNSSANQFNFNLQN